MLVLEDNSLVNRFKIDRSKKLTKFERIARNENISERHHRTRLFKR